MQEYKFDYAFFTIGGLVNCYETFGLISECDGDKQCLIGDTIFDEDIWEEPF